MFRLTLGWLVRDTSTRRERIVSILKNNGSVQVPALSEMFGVSTVTIRKDLKFLDQQGIAARSYGGAILSEITTPISKHHIKYKQQTNITEKISIGQTAATLVNPGESLILDSGTTTLHIAANLKEKKDITVVTNSLHAMNELSPYPDINLLMLGGTLCVKNMSFYGAPAEYYLNNLHVDKLFLGINGFNIQRGITTHCETEAILNRAMCKSANEIIVVADSTKLNKVCLHQVIETSKISKLITDSNITSEIHRAIESHGTEVLISRA